MRAFGPVLLASALCACVTDDASIQRTAPTQSSGAWRIEQGIDRITGVPAPKAWITTTKTTYTRTSTHWPATLALTCFDKQPIVRIVFKFKIGSNKNAKIAYRFDETPGHDAEATILLDYKTILIDDKAAVRRFMEELAGANVLLVGVNSLFAGRATAEFPVAGALAAIAVITSDCGSDAPKHTAAARG